MWRWNHWDKVCIYIYIYYMCLVVGCCLLTFFSSLFHLSSFIFHLSSFISLSIWVPSEACDDGDAITSNGCTYPTCTKTAGWYVVFSLIPCDIITLYSFSYLNIFSYSYFYSYSINRTCPGAGLPCYKCGDGILQTGNKQTS